MTIDMHVLTGTYNVSYSSVVEIASCEGSAT